MLVTNPEDGLQSGRLRALFAGASIGFSVTDTNGRFIGANDAYQRITGYSENELASTDYQSITYEPDLLANLAVATRLFAGQITHSIYEKRYVRKPGDLRWVRNSVSTIRDRAGRVLNFVALTEDISETRAPGGAFSDLRDSAYRVADHLRKSPLPERRRIADSLEGNTSQLVIALGNHLSRLGASSALSPAERMALAQFAATAGRFLSYLRRLADVLDPPTTISLGLQNAVADYLRRFTVRTGLPVKTAISIDIRVLDASSQAIVFNAVKLGMAWLVEVCSGDLTLRIYSEHACIFVFADGNDAGVLSGAVEPIEMVRLREDFRDRDGSVEMSFSNSRSQFSASLPISDL